jgi:RNA-directed DNA polymerase
MKSSKHIANYEDFEDCGLYIGNSKKLYICNSSKIKNVYPLIYNPDNIIKAQWKAQKGKGRRAEIDRFNNDIIERLDDLYWQLVNETYSPGEYRIKTIYEPKKRIIMIAPFYPDRIVHHCIINVLSQYWKNIFIENTYACIKHRGTQKCMMDVHKALTEDYYGTKYCLKIDIKKFYDNVDHYALKAILRHIISDEQLIRLLGKIIDSNNSEKGLPIGNYTSQYLANLYLSYYDHWIKEDMRIKHYFRYMDDVVILSGCKWRLFYILDKMGLYLGSELKLEIKKNWQIFPVDARGIDYVGFKQTHNDILLRKSILYRFYKKLKRIQKKYNIEDETEFKHLFPSEYGWIIRCSEKHSNYILNKCINNGNKIIECRSAG